MGLIFTWLLALAGLAVGWFNPIIGLLIYFAFALLRPPFLWHWYPQLQGPRFSMMIGASTLVGWALKNFGDWRRLDGIWLPIAGLIIYLLAGLFAWKVNAVDPVRAGIAYDIQLKICIMVIVAATLLHEEKHIKAFAWVIFICLGYIAYEFNLEWVQTGWSRLHTRGFGGIDNNGAAMIMVMGVPLAFFLGLNYKQWWIRGLCFGIAVLLMHVVLFSFSRGGQLGLGVVGFMLLVVALLHLPRKGLTLSLTALFLAMTVYLAGDQVRERFFTIFVDEQERDASAASRFDTWAGGIRCMVENPLGVGPRNFNRVSHEYGLAVNKSVHNLFIQTGADYGVAGMLGLAMFYFGTAIKCFNMSRTRDRNMVG